MSNYLARLSARVQGLQSNSVLLPTIKRWKSADNDSDEMVSETMNDTGQEALMPTGTTSRLPGDIDNERDRSFIKTETRFNNQRANVLRGPHSDQMPGASYQPDGAEAGETDGIVSVTSSPEDIPIPPTSDISADTVSAEPLDGIEERINMPESSHVLTAKPSPKRKSNQILAEKHATRKFFHTDTGTREKRHVAENGKYETQSINYTLLPEIVHRQPAQALAEPKTSENPKLAIGRLSVEVVVSEPPISRPPQKRAVSQPVTRREDTGLGSVSKLRFGLGQI